LNEETVVQARKILSPHKDLENCYCARRETYGYLAYLSREVLFLPY